MIKIFFTKISVFHSFIISDQDDNIPRYYFARKQNFAKRSYLFVYSAKPLVDGNKRKKISSFLKKYFSM